MTQAISFLFQRPVWEIILLLLFITGFTTTVILVIFTLLQKSKIKKIGKDGIEICTEENSKDTPHKPPHATCPYGRDIILILKRQSETINKIRDAHANILPEQMKYAESKAIEVRALLQKIFVKLLHEATTNTHVESRDYHLYRLCLRSIYEDLRDYIRVCFRENHLIEKTDSDYKEYVNLKVQEIIQTTTELLDDLYQGEVVQRDILHQANMESVPVIRVLLTEIFYKAREIAQQSHDQIKSLENEFDLFFLHIIG